MADLNKQETVKDILDGRREFAFEEEDNITHYFIADPSGSDIRKAEWTYSKVFNNALIDGFPTQAQMLDILTERGILSEEYTRTLQKLKLDLSAALFRLDNMVGEMTVEEQEDLALETARLRDEYFRMNQKINGPMGNTCENLADDARNEYITSRIVQKKDGSRLWENHEDYLNEDNNQLVLKCRFEVMAWLNGIESNFIEKMPEQQVLRRVAETRLENNLNKVKELASPEPPVEEIVLPDNIELKADASDTQQPVVESTKRPKARKRGRPGAKKDN